LKYVAFSLIGTFLFYHIGGTHTESQAYSVGAMKALHTAYRVQNLDRSVDFYKKLGFAEIGRVALGDETILVMLNLPGDGDVVTLELVYHHGIGSFEIGTGFSHVAVQVDDLASVLTHLAEKGVDFDGPHHPAGEGTDQEPASFPTRMATGSSWCNGRLAIQMA
jgi:lactoylglutathione lyase